MHIAAFRAAMHDGKCGAYVPAVLAGDFGTDDSVEESANPFPANLKSLARHVFIFEILGGRADDRERAGFGHITKSQWHSGDDTAIFLQLFQIHVRQILDRWLNAINRTQHQLQITALGANDQIISDAALRERAVNRSKDDQHKDHQHHAESDAESRQKRSQSSLANTFPRNGQQVHTVCSCRHSSGRLNSCNFSTRW